MRVRWSTLLDFTHLRLPSILNPHPLSQRERGDVANRPSVFHLPGFGGRLVDVGRNVGLYIAHRPGESTQDDLLAIGSGGSYAQAAARALFDNTAFSAREVVEKSLNIAGDICIYTNQNLTLEEIKY